MEAGITNDLTKATVLKELTEDLPKWKETGVRGWKTGLVVPQTEVPSQYTPHQMPGAVLRKLKC